MSRSCYCNMDEYLKTTIEKLKTQNYAALTLVLGNESCDLDSAVSALVYAAFLHWQHQLMKCKVCTRNKRTEEAKDDIFVPILNVAREDYEIKTEVVYCLEQHGVSKGNLVFKDEPSLPSPLNANIVLVDHHTLAASDARLAPLVTEIIDHRPLDKTHWRYREDCRSTVELVGSCATLVAQRIMDLSALFAKDANFFTTYPACCDMLHSTIILDTVNFSKELSKGTPHDVEVVLALETILKPHDYEAERVRKLDCLSAAKRDVSSLSAASLLRKDLKVLQGILVPSFPMLVKDFLSREGALAAVSSALDRFEASAALLLGIQFSGGVARDMAVFCADETRRGRLCAYLQEWKPSFELLESESSNQSSDQSSDQSLDQSLRYFTQLNLTATRKQYMPALKDFLSLT